MTDETGRPGSAAPRTDERDDALDTWFRPRQESLGDESARSADGDGEAASAEAADGDLTQVVRMPSGGDVTQVVRMPSASTPASASADADADADADTEEPETEGNEADEVDNRPEAEAETASEEEASGGESAREAGAGAETDSEEETPDAEEPEPPSTWKPAPANAAAAAPTQAIPRRSANVQPETKPLPTPPPSPPSSYSPSRHQPRTAPLPTPPTSASSPEPGMAVRGGTASAPRAYASGSAAAWKPQSQPGGQQWQQPPGQPPILPLRGRGGDDDDFDEYDYAPPGSPHGGRRRRRGAWVATGVVALVAAVAAALVLTGTVTVPGISAKPVPTVGFSPSGSDAGSDATQTGTAFLTAWQNGNLKSAANITDAPDAALSQLTAYKSNLKLSGLTLLPGTASAAGWMTFNVTAQVGAPSSAWSYSSGMATYSKSVNGYTRWFVKWQPSILFTQLTGTEKLGLGAIPATANKVVDRNGAELTAANAPSLAGIIKAVEQNAPTESGTPGQKVQLEKADGTVVSTIAKVSDPVNTSSVKTTIDLNAQKAAQQAVGRKANSSMVVIQPSTGNILAVANNPPGGLDVAMVGRYAPGSTFKTITSTLVLNKGVITDLNQTWDCPATLNADGITLHNSEQEAGVGKSFLWDFSDSCNNAFSRFEGKISRDDLVNTAREYYGFNQKWDVGLGQPTTYGTVPNTSSNSLAEELVGQDQITASPLVMASVAATIAHGSFKQPVLVPGATQSSATPLPAATQSKLKTLMRSVITDGTLAGVFNGQAGVYGKTGTAEVGTATPNSWTVAFKGDVAVAALAVHGGFGADVAGPECKSLLDAIS